MPKGQVTDEELASGLRSMGGLSSLTPVKRDSPFRDSRAEAKTVDVPVPAPALAVESPRVLLKEEVSKSLGAQQSPTPGKRREKALQIERQKPAQRKTEVYSDRVTLQISPEMRDEVDSLARDLQRSKTTKDERITANTVMRVAVQLLIDHFQFQRGDIANNEQQLYDLVRQKLKVG